jgi:hypothetical protein
MPRSPKASGYLEAEEAERQAPSLVGLGWLMPAILRDPGCLRETTDLAERLAGADRRRGMALLIGGEINSVMAQAAAERGEEIAAPLEEPADAAT